MRNFYYFIVYFIFLAYVCVCVFHFTNSIADTIARSALQGPRDAIPDAERQFVAEAFTITRTHLLHGINDVEEQLQDKIFEFWTHETRLSQNIVSLCQLL